MTKSFKVKRISGPYLQGGYPDFLLVNFHVGPQIDSYLYFDLSDLM